MNKQFKLTEGDIYTSHDGNGADIIVYYHETLPNSTGICFEQIFGDYLTGYPEKFKKTKKKFTGKWFYGDKKALTEFLFNVYDRNDGIENKEKLLLMLQSNDKQTRNLAIDIINANKEKWKNKEKINTPV